MLAWPHSVTPVCPRRTEMELFLLKCTMAGALAGSTRWCGHPRDNSRTTPHPWHAKIMNGPADESFLINYGGNRVLLNQRWQLQEALRHIVNVAFFQPLQPRGPLYWPSGQCWHLGYYKICRLFRFSPPPMMLFCTFHDTEHSSSFLNGPTQEHKFINPLKS